MTKFECYLEPIAYGLSVFLCDNGWKTVVLGNAVISDCPMSDADCFTGNALIKVTEPTQYDIDRLGM